MGVCVAPMPRTEKKNLLPVNISQAPFWMWALRQDKAWPAGKMSTTYLKQWSRTHATKLVRGEERWVMGGEKSSVLSVAIDFSTSQAQELKWQLITAAFIHVLEATYWIHVSWVLLTTQGNAGRHFIYTHGMYIQCAYRLIFWMSRETGNNQDLRG